MDDTFVVQEDDGTERLVTDEAEHATLAASGRLFEAETIGDGTMRRVYLNVSKEASMRAEWAASDAAQQDARNRTVMIIIDDGVMPVTEERIELQVIPGAADKATVKARIVAERGVANPNHVTVETLTDFEAGQS